jgi:type III secretory pathway lipoprotein EscJ
MGQLPDDDIPRNRYAAGYRYTDAGKRVEKTVKEMDGVVKTGNTVVFHGQEFERPVQPRPSN